MFREQRQHQLEQKQLLQQQLEIKRESQVSTVREAANKCSSTNGQAIKGLTPPIPPKLNDHRKLKISFIIYWEHNENSVFFLYGPAFPS